MISLGKVSRGPHLPTLVASSITREIAEGRLAPGDRLPTEQALAATFGVSRNVVREAIARLRSEGRIWSQQGRGAFVSDARQPSILKIEHDGQSPGEALQALFQFRAILEVQAAGLAATGRGDEDLARMAAALHDMTQALYGSLAWLRNDLAFHSAVAAATRNGYIVQVLGFVAERVQDSMRTAADRPSDDMAAVTEREHRRILHAIEAGDAAAAEAAMRAHLAEAAQRSGLDAGPEPAHRT